MAWHAVSEAEASASSILSNAAKDALGIIGTVLVAREKVEDYIEDMADQAVDVLEDSAIGSVVLGAADAINESLSFGLLHNESSTNHRKSYEAGQIIGDLASEAIGFAEGILGGAAEALGIGLDATGAGAIPGVALNIAGVAAIGHASSVMYNGASNLGKDVSDLVQSFKDSSSKGAGEGSSGLSAGGRTKPSGVPDPNASSSGTKTKVNYNDPDPDNVRALERENEAAEILAKNGYHVEQNPNVPNTTKNPDYKIEGEIFDCYSPKPNTSPRNIGSDIQGKVEAGQTDRVVLNLSDYGIQK